MPNDESDLFTEFYSLGQRASDSPPEDLTGAPVAVTVRIDPTELCWLDTLAHFSNLSRQSLVARLISSGSTVAIKAFLEAAPDMEDEFHQHFQGRLIQRGIEQ